MNNEQKNKNNLQQLQSCIQTVNNMKGYSYNCRQGANFPLWFMRFNEQCAAQNNNYSLHCHTCTSFIMQTMPHCAPYDSTCVATDS